MEALGFVVGGVVALVAGRLAIWVGLRSGFVDLADGGLKSHTGAPVPLGGAAFLLGAHVGLAVAGAFELGLLTATLLVWVVGLIDDVRSLSPALRLGGALLVGLVLVALHPSPLETADALFWVIAAVVLINAINLFDGLDALAGSVSTVAVFGIAAFGWFQGTPSPWVVIAIAGSLLGFLYWNRPPAQLFLGDNGAYVLGVFLVWAAIWVSRDSAASLVAVGLIGVPLIDLAATVIRRVLSRVPLFTGDRDHSYDQLRRRGHSEARIALLYSAGQVVWAVLVILVSVLVGDRAAAITALALGVVVAGLVGSVPARSRA